MEADIDYEEADKGPNFGIFKEHFDLASTKQFKATSENSLSNAEIHNY